MNALEIKEYLCTNEDKLIELLEHLGCINIHKRTKDEFTKELNKFYKAHSELWEICLSAQENFFRPT